MCVHWACACIRFCMCVFARVCACICACASVCLGVNACICACVRSSGHGWVWLGAFASVPACMSCRCTCVCTSVLAWARERVCVCIFRGCATMSCYRQLNKNEKIANNSLTNTVKGNLFSLHKVRTQAFLLVSKPPLNLSWYYHNFSLPVNAQQWPHWLYWK